MDEIRAGDIVWVNGPADITIGDTLSAPELADPALPPLEIEEPTVSMFFLVNNGPFAGNDGQAVTLRQIKDRLERELRVNVALRVEDLGRPDGVKVSGRGELHLGILIEEMRREGMELCVSRPEVITHARRARARCSSRWSSSPSTCPTSTRASSSRSWPSARASSPRMHNAGTGVVRLELQHPHPRPHRLPRRLPHRHPGPGHHVLALRDVALRQPVDHHLKELPRIGFTDTHERPITQWPILARHERDARTRADQSQ